MKFTKIVATLSPKNSSVEFIRSLSDAGMNVVRLNSAHLNPDDFADIVKKVREADPSLAIMVDTKGPEVRTTNIQSQKPIEFIPGDIVELSPDTSLPTLSGRISFNKPGLVERLNPGDVVIIDDGEISFKVSEVSPDGVFAVAENHGFLGSRKTVNVPGVDLHLPPLSERDINALRLAAELGIDYVAHSFVRSASDIGAVREVLDSFGSNIKIIAKIENQQGVDNFDAILEASYGIMVARGDLGIEIPAERVPGLQVMIINKCISAHKPVIVATQMLHSMIEHPRPTRAEVSDVAAAVYQRADALMLSGETAMGKYPVESVQTMSRIAREVEKTITANEDVPKMTGRETSSFLARQAVVAQRQLDLDAIVTDAHHGQTARYISSFRASSPIVALCFNRRVERLLALTYAVSPVYLGEDEPSRTVIKDVLAATKGLTPESRIAYLSGDTQHVDSLGINRLDAFF